MASLVVADLGQLRYNPAWDLQKQVQKKLIDEKLALRKDPQAQVEGFDYLLFVEHPHVYTLGKSGNAAHLLSSDEQLKAIGAEYVPIDRGGDITYHGPGQIVGYPILDLERYDTDLHIYLRNLEEVIIQVLASYGITGGRVEGLTGVWVNGAKVCAMGIKCSRWVTMHGFALNVNTDMKYFNYIVPCGITDKPVCSMQQLLGRKVDEAEVKERIISAFTQIFGCEWLRNADALPFVAQ